MDVAICHQCGGQGDFVTQDARTDRAVLTVCYVCCGSGQVCIDKKLSLVEKADQKDCMRKAVAAFEAHLELINKKGKDDENQV